MIVCGCFDQAEKTDCLDLSSNDNLMKAFPGDKSQPWPGIKLMRHKESKKNGTSMREKTPHQEKYKRGRSSFTTIILF